MNELVKMFVDRQKEFLSFLKTRFNVFHESNVFFRDLHYGVMAFLQMNGLANRYSPSEELTKQVVVAYEGMNVLIRIEERAWMVNYPLFKKAPVKAVAPARPATPTIKSTSPNSPSATMMMPQNAVVKPATVQGEVAG
jgi:hypothetical protein